MRNVFKTIISISLLALSLTAGQSQAAEDGYYKWVDDRGRPTHSDRPPPSGVAYEFIAKDGGLRRQVTAEESKASPVPKTPDPVANSQPVSEEEGAVVQNSAYCDQARANLDTLNSKARVRIRDGDGNIRFLTEEEKAAQRQKANDLIDVHCNK
jgi:hypothetical protein